MSLMRPPSVYRPSGTPLHVGLIREMESLGYVLLPAVFATIITLVREAVEEPGLAENRRLRITAVELEEVPQLRRWLEEIASFLPAARANEMARRQIACCLSRLAEWAEEAGARTTTLALAEAAYDCAPSSAHAYEVGRVARQHGDDAGAQAWWRHAAGCVNEDEELEPAVLALLGLADIKAQQAHKPGAAIRTLARARALARRGRLRLLEGDALYATALHSLEAGRLADGLKAVSQAIEVYGDEHNRIYELAFDVGWVLMERCGEFRVATDLFHALLKYSDWEGRLILVYACLARSCAALGWERHYETAYNSAWSCVGQLWCQSATKPALIQLALASSSFDYWARIEVIASHVLDPALGQAKDPWQKHARDMLALATRQESVSEEVLERVFPDSRFPNADTAEPNEHAMLIGISLIDAMQPRRDHGPKGALQRLIGPSRRFSPAGSRLIG